MPITAASLATTYRHYFSAGNPVCIGWAGWWRWWWWWWWHDDDNYNQDIECLWCHQPLWELAVSWFTW